MPDRTAEPGFLRRFAADRRGNIAILSAIFATVIMTLAALAVDTGKVFVDRRKAQGATDLAALAAVSDLANATRAAAATVTRNNFGVDSPVTVELGIYSANAALAPVNRFTPSSAGANAARVTLRSTSALTFGGALIGRSSFNVTTRAVATQSAFATFAIGSRLASINGGLLNSVLGGLLGTGITLSAMDYNALLSAQIDLFDYMSALATRMTLQGASYDSLLASQVKTSDAMNALVDVARAAYGNSAATGALNVVAQALNGAPDKVPLRSVLDAGPYDDLTAGRKPKVSASVSALDLLTALAQVANGQRQVQVALDLSIPGISSASLQLAVGERPQGSSWITVGTVGASVHTAQTRLLLTVTVAGLGAIASVRLPIYIELAAATAQLSKLTCDFKDGGKSTATISVKPSLADVWIGQVTPAAFGNFSTAPNPPAATLVSLPLVQVTGRSHVAVTNLAATPVTFTMGEIAAQTRKTVGAANFAASLLSNLMSDTQLGVNVAGLGLGLGSVAVSALVGNILAAAVSPLDQLLKTVLGTLGVGLGEADVWITGLRCDGAVLVN